MSTYFYAKWFPKLRSTQYHTRWSSISTRHHLSLFRVEKTPSLKTIALLSLSLLLLTKVSNWYFFHHFKSRISPHGANLWGKTMQSLARCKFPEIFSLTVNGKHFSNRVEAAKFFDEIIVPYVKKERESKSWSSDQKALVTFYVFKGQMTK